MSKHVGKTMEIRRMISRQRERKILLPDNSQKSEELYKNPDKPGWESLYHDGMILTRRNISPRIE